MSTPDARFPRRARVRASADFDAVFKQARRTSDPLLSLHWRASDAPARLGLAVSRKVDPHAVGRNRIKRALREQFRAVRTQLAPGDYVCVARTPAAKVDARVLRTTFVNVLQRAGALPPSCANGTMRDANPSHSDKPAPDAG